MEVSEAHEGDLEGRQLGYWLRSRNDGGCRQCLGLNLAKRVSLVPDHEENNGSRRTSIAKKLILLRNHGIVDERSARVSKATAYRDCLRTCKFTRLCRSFCYPCIVKASASRCRLVYLSSLSSQKVESVTPNTVINLNTNGLVITYH